jgi:hypothetical protein
MAVRLATLLGAVFLAAQLITGPAAAFAGTDAPPGLPAAAAQALGVMQTSPAKVAGIASYRMHLWDGGTVYAVPGGDKTIVAILKDRQYSSAESVLFRSGPFIIFAPSFQDVPSSVMIPGKQAGLEAIDTGPIVCADPTIPGPRLC